MIELIQFYRDQSIVQNLPTHLFEKTPIIPFKSDQEQCPICKGKLAIRRTRVKRKVKTVGIGTFIPYETTLYCPKHPDNGSWKSTELPMIVPPHSNFAYSVIVEVGKLRFRENRQVAEIQWTLLEKHGIEISISEIEAHINNFIFYLTAVHQDSNELIRKHIEKQGGYILHLDATCEGDSPKLVSSIDPISNFVLYSAKLKSENKDDLILFLEEIKKRLGVPLAVVSDMGKGIESAVKDVFPGIPHYICHFHFLKAIGTALFDNECKALRNALSKAGILGNLKTFRRTMGDRFEDIPISKIESFLDNAEEFGKTLIASELSVYYLVLWLLDHCSDGDGYGFPFDHSHLSFYNRLKTAYSILKEVSSFYSTTNKNQKTIWKLYHLIRDIVENSTLDKKVQQYEVKLTVFSELREALGTAPENVKNGLSLMKETGGHKELKMIKKAIGNFETDLRERIKTTDDKPLRNSFKRIIDKLGESRASLLSDPFVVEVNGSKRVIFISRTNNILEHHFRRFNYWCRRIHGNHSVRRNLENIPEQFPIVENLNNPSYLQLVFGDETNIAEKFATISIKRIREMNNDLKQKKKIHSSIKIKKAIRKPEFAKLLTSSFASAAS